MSTKYQNKPKNKQNPAQQRQQNTAQQKQATSAARPQGQTGQSTSQPTQASQQWQKPQQPAKPTVSVQDQEASRKEARAQRQAQERALAAQRKRQANIRRYAIISAVTIVVVGVIAWVVLRDLGKPGQGVDIMADRTHLAAATDAHAAYTTDPPTSGPHTQAVPLFKVYTDPIAKESQVHGLEDGGVVINYQPSLDAATVTKLADLANLYISTPGKEHIIMSPYPGLDHPIVLTTWGRIERLDTLDEPQIRAFVDTYVNIDHHEGSDGQRLP